MEKDIFQKGEDRNFSEVNRSIPKVDGMGLVKGKPAYTNDLAYDNCLIAKVLRSPYAFARIKNIDTSIAEKIEGVEIVLTYKNVPRNIFTRAGQGFPEPSPYDKYILDEYVRYVGDEVAAVAAIDEKTALKAIKLIKVEYEELEPILDFELAEGNKTIIHPEADAHEMHKMGFDASKNIVGEYWMNLGDVDEKLKECDHIVKERYYTHAQTHVALEPHSSFAMIDFQGRLNLISATQTPYHTRRIVSKATDFPIEKIKVFKPRLGGGYGGKQSLHGELIVSYIAMKTGKPVKLIYTRGEVFESTYSRHAMRFDITVGSDKAGKIKAIDIEVLSNTGAYGEHSMTVFVVSGGKNIPLYNKAEAVRFGGKVVYTNVVPAGAFRGYGTIQCNFALESAMDQLASELGIDPTKFREINMIREGETSDAFKKMGEGSDGFEMIIDSCKLPYCLERGMELFNWNERNKPRKVNGNKVRGSGMAIAMHGSGIPFVDMASAVIKMNDQGFFNLMIGATDLGTGSDTILSQIAAEALQVPVGKVIPFSSDSDLAPFDTGAYASCTTYVAGNAVKLTALKMKEMIIEEAARRFDTDTDNIKYDGVTLETLNGDKSITLAEMSSLLFYSNPQKQLIASESYFGRKSPPPYMASFAEVEVDLDTGKIDVIEYAGVVDCGTPINPNLCRIQVEGAIVQGLGMALYERVVHNKKGKLQTNNMLQYKIPTRKEITNINIEFADSYEPSGPYGAKSVGEIGIDSPPAVIANAVFNATGVRIKELPITPEKLLKELNAKR